MSKNLKSKNFNSISSIIIILIAFTYALTVGLGFYGYGIDYYGAYIKGFEYSIARATFFNYLGFKISTYTVNGFHIGVYLVTFALTASTGFLIREHLKLKQAYSLIFFLLIFIITIHTWPIIMSTSNAMRQGLTMSFLFFALISNLRQNYYWLIIFSFISILMHKSGIFLVSILFIAAISHKLFFNFTHMSKAIIHLIIGLVFLIVSYYALDILIFPDQEPTRIVNKDFRGAFVFISIVYIILSFVYKTILDNPFNLTLYYFSFISLAPLMIGLNWQYERLGMMMLIPYIFSFGFFISKRSYQIYLILAFLFLLILTIYTGMYSALLKYNPLT